MTKIDKNSRICIIGAGPGGLSTGYFLQKAGYKYVTILEKLPEVGGLCNTITFENKSFDLGANYLTPAYKKTLKLAREVGAKLYSESHAYCFNPADKKYTSLFGQATKNTTVWKFLWQSLKYFYERWRASKHLPEAGYAGVVQHAELTCTFDQWLIDKKLTALRELFKVPITLMGYGALEEIPAPYALTYMSNPTFFSLLWFGAGLPSIWPKRFIHGFQRFWQQISWNLTVITSVDIQEIKRGEKITIHFKVSEHKMNELIRSERKMEFDHLIVAVPLTLKIVEDLFTNKRTKECYLTQEERYLFGKVKTNPFCMTTFILEDTHLPHRLVNIMPVPDIGDVFIVTQQFEGNPFVSFYSRTETDDVPSKHDVIEKVKDLYRLMGSEYKGEYYTHDRWTYFPHVPVDMFKEGFYDRLEEMQGKNNTYFTGGLMAFELIEPILNYSDSLVKKYFL
ncbi:NAD(P)-binding Rossmann-like domain-containing protein [Muriicola jejuensis]|uniref:NAD(P)-binding protein n=1 Tax=Muriicola jejuensis TaxID=504488 RepID=A0A6P0UDK4_9FLAO|nr:NAD(P)/FAD-dependent oxidoreductase [Muriicola jejuensis]NER10009.1 NAD(P)-binding protein [Muriicola jejuensis]SMP03793.1 NAD(P)-binding Rossmann-like domain-containing protein [Muriicola jejuensis]